MARPPIQVELSQEEREFLRGFISKGTRKAREITRANILLLADKGTPPSRITESLPVSRMTVYSVRKRYMERGLKAAIHDDPRPGAAQKYTPKQEAEIIALACTTAPKGRNRWSIRLLVEELHKREGFKTIEREKVRLVLKKAKQSRGRRSAGA